jgi:hypothetical protein
VRFFSIFDNIRGDYPAPLSLLPPRSSSLGCDFMTLRCGHGLEAALPADLTALAAYRSHVLG